jgi:hypothetical protein
VKSQVAYMSITNRIVNNALKYSENMDIKVPVISNVIALVLLVTGAFTPGWLVFNHVKGSTIHVGLFYVAGLGTSRSITCKYIVVSIDDICLYSFCILKFFLQI